MAETKTKTRAGARKADAKKTEDKTAPAKATARKTPASKPTAEKPAAPRPAAARVTAARVPKPAVPKAAAAAKTPVVAAKKPAAIRRATEPATPKPAAAAQPKPVRAPATRRRATPKPAAPDAGLVFEAVPGSLASDNLVVQMRAHQYEIEAKGEHVPQVFAPPRRELPETYGETRLVLMPRDPEWIYAYWEISEADRQRTGASADNLTLRLYDVSDILFDGANAHSFHDTAVGGAGSWYLRLPAANRQWVADLGAVGPQGVFQVIVRSNVVFPPRNTVSALSATEEEWMTVESDFERIFELSGGRVARGATGGSEQAPALRRAAFEMPRLQMGSEALASGALMRRDAPGAGAARGFHLVVNTELIVYGATEPDARVTIQGHAVRLEPDGTFRLRIALPDGVQEIPVRAVHADGEQEREITPVVSRHLK